MWFVRPNWHGHALSPKTFRPSRPNYRWTIEAAFLCRGDDFASIFRLPPNRNVYRRNVPIVRHAIDVCNPFLTAMHLRKFRRRSYTELSSLEAKPGGCLPARSNALAHRIWPWMAAFISGVKPKIFFASICTLFCCSNMQIASTWPENAKIHVWWVEPTQSNWCRRTLTAFSCIVERGVQFHIRFVYINARGMQ